MGRLQPTTLFYVLVLSLLMVPLFAKAAVPGGQPIKNTTITIETAGDTGYSPGMEAMTPNMLTITALVLSLSCFVFMGYVLWYSKQTKRTILSTANRERTSKLVAQLCDKNQLMRVAAIQQLGQIGSEDFSMLPRAVSIITAYLKALSQDEHLRMNAKAEISACLLEISQLNTLAQTKAERLPMALDLVGLHLEGLSLKNLNLSKLDLRGLQCLNSSLTNVNFSESVLNGGKMANCRMDTVDFRKASLDGLAFSKVDWRVMTGIEEDILEKASYTPANDSKPKAKMASNSITMPDAPFDKDRLN